VVLCSLPRLPPLCGALTQNQNSEPISPLSSLATLSLKLVAASSSSLPQARVTSSSSRHRLNLVDASSSCRRLKLVASQARRLSSSVAL
ncbi:hypothetical protein S83_050878, partial [Arachis hypogaea]